MFFEAVNIDPFGFAHCKRTQFPMAGEGTSTSRLSAWLLLCCVPRSRAINKKPGSRNLFNIRPSPRILKVMGQCRRSLAIRKKVCRAPPGCRGVCVAKVIDVKSAIPEQLR